MPSMASPSDEYNRTLPCPAKSEFFGDYTISSSITSNARVLTAFRGSSSTRDQHYSGLPSCTVANELKRNVMIVFQRERAAFVTYRLPLIFSPTLSLGVLA